ncbi:hypothetical protein JXA12_01525 [Candidatus Woesearchaeota archaeon]|nr:hypothetical protein [Candidatus Woesearchaeota archaeon]
MIELGGNIRLHGFEELDHAELLIAKKLVGSYIRKVCDHAGKCEQADITMERVAAGFSLQAEVKTAERSAEASVTGANVFMAIDDALKAVLRELDIRV